MKLYAEISQLQASDLVALLPMLKIPADTTAGKLVQIFNQLPKDRLHEFLNTISGENLLDILSIAAAEYQEKILQALEKAAEKHSFPIEITNLSISKTGKLFLQINKIDYPAIVRNYRSAILNAPVSIIAENILLQNFFVMLRLSLTAGLTVLSKIPSRMLDNLVITLVNRNADKLLEKINDLLAKKNFCLQLENLQAAE